MNKLILFKLIKKDYQGTFDNGLILLAAIIMFTLFLGVVGLINMHTATIVSVSSFIVYAAFAYIFYLVDAFRTFSSDHEFLLSELTGIPASYLIGVLLLFTVAAVYFVK